MPSKKHRNGTFKSRVYCTAEEAAHVLGYSHVSEAYKLVEDGEIAEYEPKKRARKRIIVSTVIAFIKRKTKNAHLLPDDFNPFQPTA